MNATKLRHSRFIGLYSLLSAASLASALPAASQENANAVEEVTITAERRAVSVQDIPISAIALSAETLDERGVKTLDDLQYQVPSLTFTDNGNTKFVNIRGVGISEGAPNQTVGVAVHLDGAYVAREFVFGDAFFDLESVEVLRGPQGTYAGQNASGGAIFINSKKPAFEAADGFASVDLGNFGERRLSAGSSFTLSDTVAVRLSGETEKRDSYYDNHGPDLAADPSRIEDQPGNLNRSLARVQLLFQPNDDFQTRLIHEMSDVRTDGVPYKFFPVRYTNILPTTALRELNYDLNGHRNVRYDRTTATLDWAASDAFKVLANVSYLASHQHWLQDGDRNSVLTVGGQQDGSDYVINDHYWTAEVNLVSTGAGPLEWTAGASTLDYQQLNFLNFLRYNTTTGNPLFPGTGLDLARHTRLYLFLDNVRSNEAVFGEVGYQITPELQIKAGVRYNRDEVGFAPSSYQSAGAVFPAGRLSHYNAPSGALFNAPMQKFDATTGRVLINWNLNEDSLFYGTASRGYKPGGTTPQSASYLSEYVTNYEMGWKADLFDRKFSTSISAYYMNYDDFQRTYNPDPTAGTPTSQVTRNVDATIKGVEAQFGGVLGDFSWDASVAYNDGTYDLFPLTLLAGAEFTASPQRTTNLQGQPVEYLPKSTWNLGLSYQGWRTTNGKFVPSVRVSHQDAFHTTFYNYAYNLTPGKTLVDAFLAYESDSNWRAELYAKNAGDKTYISRAQGAATGADVGRGSYLLGAPRQVGLKLNYKF